MPNIIESSVSASGIYVKASDGGTVTVTPSRILEFVNELSGGDPALTKTTVQRQVAQLISDTLGDQNVTADQIVVDYTDLTGVPTTLEFMS